MKASGGHCGSGPQTPRARRRASAGCDLQAFRAQYRWEATAGAIRA